MLHHLTILKSFPINACARWDLKEKIARKKSTIASYMNHARMVARVLIKMSWLLFINAIVEKVGRALIALRILTNVHK